MSLSDFLSVEDVRQVHLAIFEDLGAEYLRSGPLGGLSRRDTLQRIRNVKDSKLQRNINAVGEFVPGTLEASWSHHMAVNAGTHLWPDANHRTAMITFSLALQRAFDSYFVMEPEAAGSMVRESKAMRDADYLRRSKYYSIAELADIAHPYRRLFAGFEAFLKFGPE